MDYRLKYLKYKNKYLNEKKNIQKGGVLHNMLALINSHGMLKPKNNFKIPDNIDIIISNMCGAINYTKSIFNIIKKEGTDRIDNLEELTSIIE